mgnify:CR=1 FL=1
MANIKLPYYKGHIDCNLSDELIAGILTSKTESYVPEKSESDLVRDALNNPIASLPLSKLAKDKKHIVIISSDHTRPVPSHITMPILLEEIRKYNKDVMIMEPVKGGELVNLPLKAQEIITELMVSLDMSSGEEIAKNLLSLYVFFNKELMNANMTLNKEKIQSVCKMMSELRDSWVQAEATTTTSVSDLSPAISITG